ncbi:HTH domain-containing protein [Natronococcus occultus]|uniref:Putative transcriptional regulator, contains C-terminal CBS domains n=1 Tax=Natronococcus occultus SP4 TaxID=694430 RepID=L0K6C8_9EURY|nr:HTH domain-containing protein [Natronococcus occultus]AGB39919.1 putative transcriptional regulator, contains C-terminal CBS domains [Natronococcus occultus SP4]
MDQIDLTNSQRTTLTALVNEYQATDAAVSARVVAEETGRNAGTIRNQMQTLSALGLVESVAGPAGGYEPTDAAYSVLDRQQLDDAETVTLARDYDRVDATVDGIDFTNVHHPDLCRAQLHFQQSVRDLENGDPIVVGPSPVAALVVGGRVVTTDETDNVVIVDVEQLQAPIRKDDS